MAAKNAKATKSIRPEYRKNTPMTLDIIQLTDTHLCEEHPSRAEDLARCLAAIEAEAQRPEFLLHTGDITHNGLESEYRTAMEAIDASGIACFVLPGNRDNRRIMLDFYSDRPYLPAGSQFFQYTIEEYDTRFIVLDTHSEHSNKGELCDLRFDLFEKMLSADKTKPVTVVMHHPPFEVSEIPDPFQFVDWSQVERFEQIISSHKTVKQIICGHVHRNIDAEVSNRPVRVLTCLAGDLRKGEVTDSERKHPVYRWHKI